MRHGWESRFGTNPDDWSDDPVPFNEPLSVSSGDEGEYLVFDDLDHTNAAFSGLTDFDDDPPLPIDDPHRNDHEESARPTHSRAVRISAVLGLVAPVVVVFGGSNGGDDTAVDPPPAGEEEPAGATEEEPPAEEQDDPAVVIEDEPAVAALADVANAVFPARLNFTATKSATIVPAPESISATPIGAMLPRTLAVTETCVGDPCTYTSTVESLIPEALIGEVPEATWVVDGPQWTLDVTWLSRQSSFGEGTVCTIEDHWTYQFTVTEAELVEGRSAATAFEGTWVQRIRLDLSQWWCIWRTGRTSPLR